MKVVSRPQLAQTLKRLQGECESVWGGGGGGGGGGELSLLVRSVNNHLAATL